MGIQEFDTDTKRTTKISKWQRVWFFLRIAIIIVVISAALVGSIRALVIQPFVVNGNSMSPTLSDREYLLVEKITYNLRTPQRGDVVIFKPPRSSERFFIKRIIGLPGEVVEINDTHVIIYTERDSSTIGEPPITLSEPYVTHHVSTGRTYGLGDDEYFVMGDNRPHSNDSRSWGAITKQDIVGQAWLKLRPWSERTLFPGKHNYEQESGQEAN